MPNVLPTNVQNEIMTKVITKLTDLVSMQACELLLLRDENKDLKNKLTCLYKTIILLKSSHSPIKINRFQKTQINIRTSLSPFGSPQNTQSKTTIKKPYAITINEAYSKGNISRNNNTSNSRKYNQKVNVSSNETQSNLMTTHEKINSSKYLSNTSSNGFITLSPRPIADYYQYNQKGYKLSQSSIDDPLLTSKNKEKRTKIIKGFKEIQKTENKNRIKVSIVKQRKK